jgi:hypothetical protein
MGRASPGHVPAGRARAPSSGAYPLDPMRWHQPAAAWVAATGSEGLHSDPPPVRRCAITIATGVCQESGARPMCPWKGETSCKKIPSGLISVFAENKLYREIGVRFGIDSPSLTGIGADDFDF